MLASRQVPPCLRNHHGRVLRFSGPTRRPRCAQGNQKRQAGRLGESRQPLATGLSEIPSRAGGSEQHGKAEPGRAILLIGTARGRRVRLLLGLFLFRLRLRLRLRVRLRLGRHDLVAPVEGDQPERFGIGCHDLQQRGIGRFESLRGHGGQGVQPRDSSLRAFGLRRRRIRREIGNRPLGPPIPSHRTRQHKCHGAGIRGDDDDGRFR